MSTEEEAIEAWVKWLSPMLRMKPEMAAKVPGNEPLVIAADPNAGLIWLGVMESPDTVLNCYRVRTIAKWSAVQGEQFVRLHERAMEIIENGAGSMR